VEQENYLSKGAKNYTSPNHPSTHFQGSNKLTNRPDHTRSFQAVRQISGTIRTARPFWKTCVPPGLLITEGLPEHGCSGNIRNTLSFVETAKAALGNSGVQLCGEQSIEPTLKI